MSRPAMLGHVSPETAYVVDDYPYGYRLRCKIRYWIETNKNGQRSVAQTTNPKKTGEVWNAPKKSTYNPVRVMYLDAEGHVAYDVLNVYDSEERVNAFLLDHGEEALMKEPHVKNVVGMLRRVAQRAKETRP